MKINFFFFQFMLLIQLHFPMFLFGKHLKLQRGVKRQLRKAWAYLCVSQ